MFYKELKGTPLLSKRLMVEKLKNRALKQLGITEDELVIRSLRPEDLTGTTTGDFHFATGGTGWVNYVNTYTIADNRFIGIYGISDGSSNVSQLRIARSGSDTRIWNIQSLQMNENKMAYVDDPFTVDQNNELTIEGYALASATEKLRFLGIVAEKKGVVVSP